MSLSRRSFIRNTGAAALGSWAALPLLSAQSSPLLLGTPAARQGSRTKTLVVLFLRGGTDGLNLVVPHGDPHYTSLRPTIAQPKPGDSDGVIDLDGFFGLHARLAPIAPLFESGLARAIHAVGYDRNSRSHFEEQDRWETALIGDQLASSGWLNRHLGSTEGRGPVRAVAVGDNLPRILKGPAEVFAFRNLAEIKLPELRMTDRALNTLLRKSYRSSDSDGVSSELTSDLSLAEQLEAAGVSAVTAAEELARVTQGEYQSAVEYPKSALGRKLREVARVIKADVGTEIAVVSLDGWDTHRGQGRGPSGQLGQLARTLAESVRAFADDLEDRLDDTLLITLSDFGRTAFENGSEGTDHGWGNCLFAVGGALKTGVETPVLGKWPGLAKDQLHDERDLEQTTDFRSVIAEVVTQHLDNPNLDRVIPGFEPEPVHLLTRPSARRTRL